MLDESKFSLIDGKKLFCMNLNIATLLSVCVERPTLFRATSLQAVRSQYFDIQTYFSVF